MKECDNQFILAAFKNRLPIKTCEINLIDGTTTTKVFKKVQYKMSKVIAR